MIGGQHHHIVDALPVQVLEELAEDMVEREHLDAHLAAARAEAVADIIGGGQADDQEVGGRALAEAELVPHALGEAEDLAVEIGRRPEGAPVACIASEAARTDRCRAAGNRDGAARGPRTRQGAPSVRAAAPAPPSTSALAAPTTAGASSPPRASVTKTRPPQYQRWVGIVAAHHDRSPVLAGHGDDPTARIGALHQIAERRHAQMEVGDGVIFRRRAGHALVLGAIDIFVRPRRALIVPVVGDDPGATGPVAGQDGRMAWAGLGRRVRLVAGGEHNALRQAAEPARVVAAIFGEEVGGELIDRNGNNQPRPGRGRVARLLRRRGHSGKGQQGGEQLELHGTPQDQARSRRRPMATQTRMTTGTSTADSTTFAIICPSIRSAIGRTP